jgi:hypothetical protein
LFTYFVQKSSGKAKLKLDDDDDDDDDDGEEEEEGEGDDTNSKDVSNLLQPHNKRKRRTTTAKVETDDSNSTSSSISDMCSDENDESDVDTDSCDEYLHIDRMDETMLITESRRFVETPPDTKIPSDTYGSFTPCSALQYDRNVIIPLQLLMSIETYRYANNVWEEKANRTDERNEPVPILNNYRRSPGVTTTTENDCKRGAHDIEYANKSDTPEVDCEEYMKLSPTEQDVIKDQRFANLNHWVIQVLKDNKLCPSDVKACSSGGGTNTVHLIVAALKCKSQHFHFDYDPETFRDDQNVYKGSSMFINFRNSWTTLDIGWCHYNHTKRKHLLIPPMSILVIRGDFKHAGSANLGKIKIMKYFMYLDPYDDEDFRAKNCDTLFYDDPEERKWILTPAEISKQDQIIVVRSGAK